MNIYHKNLVLISQLKTHVRHHVRRSDMFSWAHTTCFFFLLYLLCFFHSNYRYVQGSMLRAVGRLWRVKISLVSEIKVSLASWRLENMAKVFHQNIGEWNYPLVLYKKLHFIHSFIHHARLALAKKETALAIWLKPGDFLWPNPNDLSQFFFSNLAFIQWLSVSFVIRSESHSAPVKVAPSHG